jgi:hypothetical protein
VKIATIQIKIFQLLPDLDVILLFGLSSPSMYFLQSFDFPTTWLMLGNEVLPNVLMSWQF